MLTLLRRNLFWLRFEVALAIGALVATAVAAPLAKEQDDLLTALSARVVAVLEQSSPAQHHDHGHEVAEGDKVMCAAEAFGTEPPTARRVAEVQVVYATYFCASAKPGTPWDFASRISGPVAVTLANPPVVRTAQAGLGYRDGVKALIPARHHEQAFAGFADHTVPLQVRRRYEAAISRS
ncbi:MAG: hypothetical protein HOV79_29045 [Hamadaea sp.]|nr:hypothetical protein [Hamadaea sp.]